jgi:hypothetical protein
MQKAIALVKIQGPIIDPSTHGLVPQEFFALSIFPPFFTMYHQQFVHISKFHI